MRDEKTKRYFLNQLEENRTRNILTKDNVLSTIEIFSEFLTIVLNAMIQNNINKRIA